jgi:ubiquinone/menaquinone biosynthesis C-methylase UbiE
MNHADYVDLLRPAGLTPGGVWADLGAGSGAFTVALRELIGPQAEVYAVDKDAARLAGLSHAWKARFGDSSHLHPVTADLRHALDLPPLDGVVMANSLHFFKDKETVLRNVRGLLKSGGALLLVEYNVDRGNLWVPHPLSFETFHALAPKAGFGEPRLLARHPSSFLREFYSAMATA